MLKKKKKSSLGDKLEQKSSTSGARPSWMSVGAKKIDKQIKRQKAEAMTMSAPEFWLQDGEVKQVRFTTHDPLCSIFRYSVQVKGRFRQFTAPAEGEEDPFAEAGVYAGLKVIYEVIDVTGYKDKKTGKRVKNVRRFWPLTSKLYEQLQRIQKKKGDITKFNIEVSRSGSGQATTYTLLPEDRSPMPKPEKGEPLANKVAEYYKPISPERARQIVGSQNSDDDSED